MAGPVTAAQSGNFHSRTSHLCAGTTGMTEGQPEGERGGGGNVEVM